MKKQKLGLFPNIKEHEKMRDEKRQQFQTYKSTLRPWTPKSQWL